MNNRLRIATWNIGGGHTINSGQEFDYSRENLSYFADILRPLELDIICLQESHTRDGDALSRRLADMVGLPYVFDSPRSPSHIDPNYQLANAIISRYPIKNTRNIQLPYPPFEMFFKDGTKARQFHTYLQTIEIQGITVANTHLQPLGLFGYSWDDGEGKKLAFGTEDVIIDNLTTPLVFTGDFNTPRLQKNFLRLMATFQLTPALDEQPTNARGDKLDYILYSPEFTAKNSALVRTKQSDHYLGWAELELAGVK